MIIGGKVDNERRQDKTGQLSLPVCSLCFADMRIVRAGGGNMKAV